MSKELDKLKEEKGTPEDWRLLKGAFLSKKQGETIERISRPKTVEEVESLGDMGPRATACLSLYKRAQGLIEQLTGFKGNLLIDHAHTLYRGSAQRNFTRGEKLLESIGQIGQYMPLDTQRGRLPPEHVDFNKKKD